MPQTDALILGVQAILPMPAQIVVTEGDGVLKTLALWVVVKSLWILD